MQDFMLALTAGFFLDLLLGDPEWLYHPVRLIGKYISWMEKMVREGVPAMKQFMEIKRAPSLEDTLRNAGNNKTPKNLRIKLNLAKV